MTAIPTVQPHLVTHPQHVSPVDIAPAITIPAPASAPASVAAPVAAPAQPKNGKPAWVKVVARYQVPRMSASMWQVCNSFIPYILLWVLMGITIRYSYPLTLALSVLAGLFVMRIFIIQHDCGHTSFFKNRKWNDIVGFICGVISLTPYEFWRSSHAKHHATSGDLDERGFGDVDTWTVKEYLEATPTKRLLYRLYRNPFIMFGLGPMYLFLISQRTPIAISKAFGKRERRSLYYTDLAVLVQILVTSWLIGFQNFVLIELPIALVAGTLGVWLFYVQHQFEDTYWRHHPEWDYTQSALQGSSFYKLPKIMQWFTGNIGYHHIHHLSPRIPNYTLEQCHNENPMFQDVPTLTVRSSLKILFSRLSLWDEEQLKLVNFDYVHATYLPALPAAK